MGCCETESNGEGSGGVDPSLEARVAELEVQVEALQDAVADVSADLAIAELALEQLRGVWTPFVVDEDTTDNTPQSLVLGSLPVVGAAIWVRGRVSVTSDDGQTHAWRFSEGTIVRASGGVAASFGLDGIFGYEGAAVPWSNGTINVALALGVSGNDLVLNYTGLTGVALHWDGVVERRAIQGATLA